MTVSKLFEKGKNILSENKIENFANEARWIFEAVFAVSSQYLFFNANDEANAEKSDEFIEKINRRVSGEPVQYIIGSWDFYGETFKVGEGVLIPRPETELLIDFAVDNLKGTENPIVIDLCSGSGCIGLTVARLFPNAKVYMLEKSDKAFAYLSENKNKFGCNNSFLIHGDIFEGFETYGLPEADLILSNPPYIESNEISQLQSEVLKEPVMALDGGTDGLDFYRCIADKWLPYCKGAVAVECGENQHLEIAKLFSSLNVSFIKDFNDINRVVCGSIK